MDGNKTLMKYCPSILRMDSRICRSMCCCYYNPEQDGKSCFEPLEECPAVKQLINDAETEWEHEQRDIIEEFENRVDNLRDTNKELEEKLDARYDMPEELAVLKRQLQNVLDKLDILQKK